MIFTPQTAALALGIVYFGILLPKYATIDRSRDRRITKAIKMCLSGTFCLTGLIGLIYQRFDTLAALVFAGLVLGLIGDYFLLYMATDRRKFKIGVVFFAGTQVMYIVAMTYAMGGATLQEFIIFAVLAVIITVIMILTKPNFGREKAVLLVYLALVTYMGAKAIAMPIWQYSQRWLIFGVGGALFYLSDMVLAYWKCVKKRRYLRGLNSILYFTGQYLIAISLLALV